MEDYITEERKKAFKSGKSLPYTQSIATLPSLVHKREEYAMKLRKEKKDATVREKRVKAMQVDIAGEAVKKEKVDKVLKAFDPLLVDETISMVWGIAWCKGIGCQN